MFSAIVDSDLDEYLAGLNRNFDRWGSRSRLAWVLRAFGGQSPDVFASRGDAGLVAGSVVSYRMVGDGKTAQRVGIMTGSWTDPEVRGRGAFTQMIDHSLVLARDRGAAALLAFVTAENASRRRLEAAGSRMIPTWYMTVPAPVGRVSDWPAVSEAADVLTRLDKLRATTGQGRRRFLYPDANDFRCHLLDRSKETSVLVSGAGEIAVVERAGPQLRVLASSAPRIEPRMSGVNEVFMFTADPAVADSIRGRRGSRVAEGFLAVLPIVDDWRSPSPWQIEAGDRM